MNLQPYAVSDTNTRGRQFPTTPASDRNEFQRDYTRILHSRAFGRLQQKTQVFSANLGDSFRTRMTHSLEVEQVARAVARQLGANEDLCGVLAIGHDIGHAPFGHMGQDILNELFQDVGGFEHNLQAIRLVDELESVYPEHPGLNLCFETREGLLKHCTAERALKLGDVAERHRKGLRPSLEAQIVDKADAIAYVHADLEDAFTMGLLSIENTATQVGMVTTPGYAKAWQAIAHRYGEHPTQAEWEKARGPEREKIKAVVKATIREMFRHAVADLVAATRVRLDMHNPKSPDEVRALPVLADFSASHAAQHRQLKRFSRENIYTHPQIEKVRHVEERILKELVQLFREHPHLVPVADFDAGLKGAERSLALMDVMASMTDRYVIQVHETLKKELHATELLTMTVSQSDAAKEQDYSPHRHMRR